MKKHCEICHIQFETDQKVQRFCSKVCGYAGRHNAGAKRIRVIRTCIVCSSEFEINPSGNSKYCSKRCWQSGHNLLTIKCKQCKKHFRSFRSNKSIFCSRICYASWQHTNVKGSKHPSWKGGTSKHYRRGNDWKDAAAAARKRDNYRCQRCGILQTELGTLRKRLDVHHIIPWAISRSNDLSNLISLCRKCHCAVEPNAIKAMTLKRWAKSGNLILPLHASPPKSGKESTVSR